MKNKVVERLKSRELRSEGKSIKWIARSLQVSQSSVSTWVRDIVLTEEQKIRLFEKSNVSAHTLGMQRWSETCKERRISWQSEGRTPIFQEDREFIACCMLYWAEGTKNRNCIQIANTDADMLAFFVSNMKRVFYLNDSDFSLSVQCYSDNGLALDDITSYWCESLGLPNSCFRKCLVDNISKYSQKKKKNKHKYGTCKVGIHSTELAQKIYGAIQEFVGFTREEWLW